jgi:hypothetical protein
MDQGKRTQRRNEDLLYRAIRVCTQHFLCYCVLCYAVRLCVVLCYAVPCCAVICCALIHAFGSTHVITGEICYLAIGREGNTMMLVTCKRKSHYTTLLNAVKY